VDGPRPVTLPALTGWKYSAENPESAPDFDDSGWVAANHPTTTNPTKPATLPVLYADDYGYHYGDVWSRGQFAATGADGTAATGISLTAGTGRAGAWQVWLNGTPLGTVRTGNASGTQNSSQTFTFPPGLLRPGSDNVLSVLVRNMGHNEDGGSNDAQKAPRGLLAATLLGSDVQLGWKIQGTKGGEQLADPTRGPLNNGGLYGERSGWSLPGFPDRAWPTVALPHPETAPGISWYRTTVRLNLPAGQDVPVGLTFTDDPARHYRVLIFVNGWNLGQYVNDLGPQHTFVLPQGILHAHGVNTIALAVWSDDATTGSLGQVSLTTLGNATTSTRVRDVVSPSWAG
jgi:beta-galactosidase GanA